MEKKIEYTKPEIADYGDLQELTAQGGIAFVDVPQGTPGGTPGGVTGSVAFPGK